jgi:hypothetical protein
MEVNQCGDVHVTDAIAIGETKRLVVQVLRDAGEAPTGHSGFPGVHNSDLPRLCFAPVDFHVVFLHVEGDIGHVEEIIGEILFDHVALITRADDKIIDAMGTVGLEDVPKNGPSPDFHHGLGLEVGFFGETGPQTPGKDNGFHSGNELRSELGSGVAEGNGFLLYPILVLDSLFPAHFLWPEVDFQSLEMHFSVTDMTSKAWR